MTNEAKIYNGTAHTINFYNRTDCYEIQGGRKLVKNPGAQPIALFLAGTNLSAQTIITSAPAGIITDIPLSGVTQFTSVDPLPEGYDLYIVSQLYRAAAKEVHGYTANLCTVQGTVYENEEAVRPCGCLSLSVG
jgi:hypothetical protein